MWPTRRGLQPRRCGTAQRRQGHVECQAVGHDGVVAALDERDESRPERHALLAREIGGVAGAAQQYLHPARPILLFDLDQRLQFPQMMRVAQCVQHARHRVVGLPVVMHHDADHAGQHAAALGADPIESQQSSRGDVQPLGLAADAKAGLVQMLDLARMPPGRTASAKPCSRSAQRRLIWAMVAGDQAHAEQVGHQRGQAILRQELVVQQIDHDGADPRAVLHRRRHPCGNAARVAVPHAAQRQPCARCSVTTSGRGSGRSNTCRAT